MKIKIILIIRLSFLSILILLNTPIFSQVSVNCGEDLYSCATMYGAPTIYLGKNLSVNGGTPPYSYVWSSKTVIPIENFIFTIDDFLDNKTLPNPKFIFHPDYNIPIEFILTVTDADNNVGIDTINFTQGKMYAFPFSHSISIPEGDSVQFLHSINIAGGIEPVQYYWYPSTYLKDSSVIDTWVKPESSTTYSQYFIDAKGCVSDTFPLVYVHVFPPINITEVDSSQISYRINNGSIYLENVEETISYTFININGQVISRGHTTSNKIPIPLKQKTLICIIKSGETTLQIKLYI